MEKLSFIHHRLSNGKTIRYVAVHGKLWFSATDISKLTGIANLKNRLNRFGPGETLKMNCGGSQFRLVSDAGMMALIPSKSEYYRVRKVVVELIRIQTELIDKSLVFRT